MFYIVLFFNILVAMVNDIELTRGEWESYVKAKMLQAKLDGSNTSIFVKENFGGDYGHTIDEVYKVASERGWLEYVGEVEYLNTTTEAWLTDMGVVLETGAGPVAGGEHVNCYPSSHLEEMKERGKVTESIGGKE